MGTVYGNIMQQLTITQWLRVEENFQANLAEFPSQQAFINWLEDKVPNQTLKLVDLNVGLDRAQAHLTFNDHDFNLCFDATCDAIWLEPISKVSNADTDSILVMLSG